MALIVTWLLYIVWAFNSYEPEEHFILSLTFTTVTFLIFYTMFLVTNVVRDKKFLAEDVFLLLANSLIYYMVVYSQMEDYAPAERFLGLFTLVNGLIHLAFSIIIYFRKAEERIFYFTAGLAATFISITIPIELDGNMVTLLWSVEAAVLFAVGRRRQGRFYELFAYVLMLCAFFNLFNSWNTYSHTNPPILNIQFLTTLVYILSSACIFYLSRRIKPEESKFNDLLKNLGVLLNIALIIALYNVFRIEIVNYVDWVHDQVSRTYTDSYLTRDPYEYRFILQFVYSVVFVSIISHLNGRYVKSDVTGKIFLVLHVLVIACYLLPVLFMFGELRDSFISGRTSPVVPAYFVFYGRYLTMATVAGSLMVAWRRLLDYIQAVKIHKAFLLMIHIAILWTLSSELIQWLDLAGFQNTYKLGLSILWGCYAVFLIIRGIQEYQKYLRVSAIVLFGLTLLKLFSYDLESLSTIQKVVVMVALGVLLLITSFLYNKYKDAIGVSRQDEPPA
jgi:uncharacterized membrane protein